MIDETMGAGEWIGRVSDMLYAMQRCTRGQLFDRQWEDYFEAGLELADLSSERAGFGRMLTRIMGDVEARRDNVRLDAEYERVRVHAGSARGLGWDHYDGLD